MTEHTHNLQQQIQQIKQHQSNTVQALAEVVRSYSNMAVRLLCMEGSIPTEEIKGETDPGASRPA